MTEVKPIETRDDLIEVIDYFMDRFDPTKELVGVEAIKSQQDFWKSIETILNKDTYEVFTDLWLDLITNFREHVDTIFNPNFMYRFFEHWELPQEELDSYKNILNLIMQSADPRKEKVLHDYVNFLAILRSNLSSVAKTNIIKYYSL